ncbi:MAG: hypothetical protein IV100_23435 [Myxococcales bacterium]|nr:hypothetical protein [Myxococcales bacterium]
MPDYTYDDCNDVEDDDDGQLDEVPPDVTLPADGAARHRSLSRPTT